MIRFSFLLFFAASLNCFGQQANEAQSISDLVNKLFAGMQRGDSALVHSTFAETVTTATVFKDKNDNVILDQDSSIKDFLTAIGTPHKEVWYEEIWNQKIQIDGEFAQLWCDYAFYIDNTFSHCGVDAFHLYKSKDGWRIFHLADTRKKTDCNVPLGIQQKHK